MKTKKRPCDLAREAAFADIQKEERERSIPLSLLRITPKKIEVPQIEIIPLNV